MVAYFLSVPVVASLWVRHQLQSSPHSPPDTPRWLDLYATPYVWTAERSPALSSLLERYNLWCVDVAGIPYQIDRTSPAEFSGPQSP
jgi:hypothetical protein